MKKYSILLAAAAVFAAVSCEKEAPAPEEIAPAGEQTQTTEEQTLTNPITITFSANAETKVSLEGEGTSGAKTAVWDEGDQVKIIWYNSAESTPKDTTVTVDSHGTASTTFTARVEEADYYYAVYPASVEATLDGKDNFTVNFPDNRTLTDSFADAAWYAAKTTKTDKSFVFHPVSTVIKFIVDGSKSGSPTHVYFRGMSGGGNYRGITPITFANEDGYPITIGTPTGDDAKANVTGLINGSGTYYLSLPASGQTTTNGFILQLKKSGVKTPAAYYSANIVQTPGKFYNIKAPVDNKIIKDYYVAPESSSEAGNPTLEGYGTSSSNPATYTWLQDNIAAFKFYDTMSAAFILNGTTIHLMGSATSYDTPLSTMFPTANRDNYSYTIQGGEGEGKTTFTTSATSSFGNAKATVLIKDLTFSGCTTEPAVKVSAGTVNLDNVTFNACTSQGLNVSDGTVNASNGTAFTNNTTYEAAYISGGTLNLDHVTFSGNSARGLYIAAGTVSATNSCSFSNNTKKEDSPSTSSKHGGAVIIQGGTSTNASFSGCTFDNNSNDGNAGGAILTTDADTKADFTNCTFTRNTANHGGVAYTGNGIITFKNCTFGGSDIDKNSANNYAAVFYNASAGSSLHLVVNGGEISYNTAKNGCVVYTNQAVDIDLKNVTIDSNKATGGTGGVANIGGANLSFSGCTVKNNKSSGNGAVANYSTGSFKADNTVFLSNQITGSSTGAVLYCAGTCDGPIYFTNCKIILNNGKNNGAVIHLASTQEGRVFAMNNCLFYDNSGAQGGNNGVINANSANLIILNSTLIDKTLNCVIRTGCPTTYGFAHCLMANNIISNEATGCYSINLCNSSYRIKSSGYNQYSPYNDTSLTDYYSMNGTSDNAVGVPSYTAPTALNDYTWSWTNSAATGMASAETLENLINNDTTLGTSGNRAASNFLSWLKSIKYTNGNAWEVDLYGNKRSTSAYWPGCYQND